MPPIGKLIEVILYVNDMDSQVAFYRDVLGFPVTFPQRAKSYQDEYWVTLNAGVCVLALHGGGQGRLGADAPKLVFHVTDIHGAREYLRSKNVEIGEIRSAAPGVWVCDASDPEGNKFSIEAQEAS